MSIGLLEMREVNANGRQQVFWCDDASKLPTSNADGLLQTGDIIFVIPASGAAANNICYFCSSASPFTLVPVPNDTVRTVTGSATLAINDRWLIEATSGAITLQSASVYPVGQPYTLRATQGTTTLTITPTGASIASGTNALAAGASITTVGATTIITDGTSWYSV